MAPFVGCAESSEVICTGRSASRKIPAYRSAMPWPGVEKITLSCASNAVRSNSQRDSTLPRIGSMGEKSRNTALESRSLPKEFKERTGIASRLISSPSAGQSRKVTFSTGSGAFPPIAALDHEAAKNSAFVSIRSAVRDFIRS